VDGGDIAQTSIRVDTGCRSLKRLPIGIEKLSNLKDIEIDKDVWERSSPTLFGKIGMQPSSATPTLSCNSRKPSKCLPIQ
jgi:hypothetical protein